MILEIRTYRLLAGTGAEFVRVMGDEGVPLLHRHGITVVRHGLSEVADDGHQDAFLVRAFDSLESRERQEEAFYGSDDWTLGPRTAVLACIESYHTVVIEVPDVVVAGLAS